MKVLRLMGACNNKCRFCMVYQEINQSRHTPLEELREAVKEMKEGEQLDFFGGEPTLYPHFWELLEFAFERKLKVSMATNCRIMANPRFINRLREFPIFPIRTSLYGHTAEIHDYYTRANGSFNQTIKGIQNLCDMSNPPRVNTVMLEKNYEHLSEVAELLEGIGVKGVKFSSVFGGKHVEPFLIDYNKVIPYLHKALVLGTRMNMVVKVEKSPYCMAPRFVNRFIAESDLDAIDSYRKDHTFPESCKICKMQRACCGVLLSYYLKFKTSGLKAFDSVPETALRKVSFSSLEEFIPHEESEFISIEFSDSDRTPKNILNTLRYIKDIKNKFPQVYFVNSGGISI